jgi:hypothetical protein
MRKLFALGISCMMLLLLSGCGGKKMGGAIEGEKIYTEGWLNDDTYQVIAWGEASPDAVGVAQWRNQAKEGAQMMAEKRVIEKFKGYALEANGYTENGANVMVVVTKDVQGTARGGEIVRTTFDNKNKACEMIYRVSAKNLKKRIKEGFKIKQ